MDALWRGWLLDAGDEENARDPEPPVRGGQRQADIPGAVDDAERRLARRPQQPLGVLLDLQLNCRYVFGRKAPRESATAGSTVGLHFLTSLSALTKEDPAWGIQRERGAHEEHVEQDRRQNRRRAAAGSNGRGAFLCVDLADGVGEFHRAAGGGRARPALSENARALALLNMAISDGAVAAFDTKYHHRAWRQDTAIHAGDADGNSRTYGDLAFEPFIVAPCFPSYASAHASLNYSAREVPHSGDPPRMVRSGSAIGCVE